MPNPKAPNNGTHELRERYSEAILAKLRAETIFLPLMNRRYEGNPTAGAVKIPVRDTEVTVKDYDVVAGVEMTTSTTTYKVLPIDKAKSVNELIDGYEAAAVPGNLVADRLDSAGYSLAKTIDDSIFNMITTTSGITELDNTTASTVETIYANIVDAVQAAKKKHLRPNEMWLVVDNPTYGLLLKDKDHFVTAVQGGGNNVVQNGRVGRIAGVDVYESQNFPADTDIEFILGNSIFAHFVDEWGVPVGIYDLADGKHIGASAVQGRRVYGEKLSRPETFFIKKKITTEVPSVELDNQTATVAVDSTTTLTATTVPTDAEVTWASDDETVATVANGTVTGVSAGTANVTATITVDGTDYSDTCAVTVTGE